MPLQLAKFLSFADLHGRFPSLDEVIEDLEQIPAWWSTSFLSWISITLDLWRSQTDLTQVHLKLYPLLLDPLRCSVAIYESQLPHPTVFIHRRVILFLYKALLLRARFSIDWPSEDKLRARIRMLGSIIVKANDHCSEANPDKTFTSMLLELINVGEAMNVDVLNRMTRAYLMLVIIPQTMQAHPEYLDFGALFERRTGLSLSRFMALIWTVMVKYQNPDSKANWLNGKDYAFTFSYVQNTKISKRGFLIFLSIVSAKREEFREKLLTLGLENDDFSLFKEKPMLRIDDAMIPLDLAMLIEKFEAGPFWEVRQAFSPQSQQIFNFWGECFERYVLMLLSHSLSGSSQQLFEKPTFADGYPICDGIIVNADSFVILEIKASILTSGSKYSRNVDALEREIKKKLIVDDGASQLSTATRQLIEGRELLPEMEAMLAPTKKMYSLLITLDRIGSCLGFTHYVNTFPQETPSRIVRDYEISKTMSVGIDDLELISGHLKELGLSSLLAAWIAEEPTLGSNLRSFFPQGLRGGNSWLRSQFSEVGKQVLEEIGLKPDDGHSIDWDHLEDYT